MRAFVVLTLAAACGGSTAPKPAQQAGPPAPLTATPASSSDVQVATVNGKPVYGSCVSAQAARGATRQQALHECIDFELLAQHAEAYASDPEVVLETHTALVSQLIAREYEDKFNRPADFGTFWDRSIEKNRARLIHGEARASAYLRISVAKDATPEVEAQAKALAEELADKLASERGLMAAHLAELGKQIIGTRAKVDFAVTPAYLDNGGLVDEYAKPLFAIPQVGRTSKAVRTPWGWDVILLTELFPAENPTPEALAKLALPEIKRSYFTVWATQLAQKHSVNVFEDNLPLLEDL